MDRALIALCALVLNAALAGRWTAFLRLRELYLYPVAFIRAAERRLNREHRGLADRQWRGMLLTVFTLFAAVLVGWVLSLILGHPPGVAEALILVCALPLRPTWDRVSGMVRNLRTGNASGARASLAATVWRHYAVLDEFGVARAGIEMLAVNFSEKILAPILFYILFGLPGLCAVKALTLLHETLTQGPEGFGKSARQAHDIVHYAPSRLAAILWLAAAIFFPSVPLKEAAQAVTGEIVQAPPQKIVLLAAATVSHLSLGGPASAYGTGSWVGSGTAKPTAADMARALRLFALLQLFLFILLGLAVG